MAWPCRDRAWQAPREGAWPPLGCPGCRAGSDFSHVALGQPLGQTTSIRRLEVFTVCHDPLVRGVVMSARPKDMGRISHLMDLPTCGLHRLGEIAELVASVRLSPIRKRKLALALRKKGYIPKLLHLFQVCERVKNTEGLHFLFDIVRGILYLDKNILFEVLFSDECILGVAGCLEYDPSLAQPGWHREFLTKAAKRQEVIPIRDPELREKIRQTSRAQYIYDIIVPNSSDFEVGFLSTLNSFISSSKEEILEALQKDKEFLPDVFAQLRNEATAGEQQCELLKFFKEFCAFSCTSPEKRDELLQTLAKLGFLPILEMLLVSENLELVLIKLEKPTAI
ncbi:serine/threonine-protein phosphatase 4 regulatory subunit 3B-like [Anomalospiza imberbis]|uniref:serine/threonine-protein phosphatase 4 regulatory subunit 3B-like n=1 Tax=Anomalospiza imberbis TaxID=187417 RepID=UPI00358F6F18